MHLGLRNLKRFRGRVLIYWGEEPLPEVSPWKQCEGLASPLCLLPGVLFLSEQWPYVVIPPLIRTGHHPAV